MEECQVGLLATEVVMLAFVHLQIEQAWPLPRHAGRNA